MISRTLAAGLLAAGCVTAAAGGAYFGVRHNAAAAPAQVVADAAPPPVETAIPVSETEATVGLPSEPMLVENPRQAALPEPAPRGVAPAARNEGTRNTRPAAPRSRERRDAPPPVVPVEAVSPDLSEPMPPTPPATEPVRLPDPPPPPPEPVFEELIIPSSSVIGLQVETPLSSERARVEDRVDARVTRDVLAAGRVAIPAGSRVVGAVTMVERGGKVRERAQLGVRFHTVVLSDGSRVPLSTEAILREGEAPSGESARKIGGAAIGGAILGAIINGKKGAAIGGAAGAGAGTAAVMTGDRNAATLPAGTIVTVRLSAPAAVEVERR